MLFALGVFSYCWLNLLGFSLQHLADFSPPPDLKDYRVDDQLQDEGGDDSAYHGGRDPFHYVRPGPMAPHDRQESHDDGHHGHHLRAHALDRPLTDGLLQVFQIAHLPLALPFFIGVIQVEEHDYPSLGIHSGESNDAYPDCHAHIVP